VSLKDLVMKNLLLVGDIVFVYDTATEQLTLCFNHGLLDGMTAVETIVAMNRCNPIRR